MDGYDILRTAFTEFWRRQLLNTLSRTRWIRFWLLTERGTISSSLLLVKAQFTMSIFLQGLFGFHPALLHRLFPFR